jgi:hypothetical protein
MNTFIEALGHVSLITAVDKHGRAKRERPTSEHVDGKTVLLWYLSWEISHQI